MPRLSALRNCPPVAGCSSTQMLGSFGSVAEGVSTRSTRPLAARPPGFHGRVANVQFNADNGIVMQLSSGLKIRLGPPLDLQSKLRSAAWVLRRYRTKADRGTLVYADVSAPDNPAVMPKGGYSPTMGLGDQAKKTSKSAQDGA